MVIVEDILKLFSKNLPKALPLFLKFSQAEENHDFFRIQRR